MRNAALKENHRWGLDDGEMFDLAMKHKQTDNHDAPIADVYLTLSTHEPFDLPEIDKYKKLAAKRAKTNNPQEQKNIDANLNIFGCFMYTDNCVRRLFEYYKSRPDYDNTIFIITGDHNFNDNTFILERYHVPLIIWSPMLTERRDIKALASHRDITPTLLALLGSKYDISTPQNVAWLNTGLDTATTFRSRLFSPQIELSRELKQLVYNDFYVYGDEVYQFTFDNETLNIEPVTDKSLCDSLLNMQRTYRELDYFVCKNDALINKYTIKSHKLVADINIANASDSTIPKGEYTNLLELPLTSNHNTLNIKFWCSRKATLENELALVFEIRDKKGNSLYYDSNRIPVFEGFNWSGFDCEAKINVAKYFEKGSVLKIYIWNKDARECYITDIRLNVDNIQ